MRRTFRARRVAFPVSLFKEDFVQIAPHPMLARLLRSHDRMMRSAKVLGCVLVFGGVTTAYVSAGETDAEMDPGVTDFQAVFATGSTRRNLADLFQVGAGGHRVHAPSVNVFLKSVQIKCFCGEYHENGT
jgi:hypothetical protein